MRKSRRPTVVDISVEVSPSFLLEASRFLLTAQISALQPGMSAQKCLKGIYLTIWVEYPNCCTKTDFRMNSSSLEYTGLNT